MGTIFYEKTVENAIAFGRWMHPCRFISGNVRSIQYNMCKIKKTIEYRLRTTRSDRKSLLKPLYMGKNIYKLALSHCKKQLNRSGLIRNTQGCLLSGPKWQVGGPPALPCVLIRGIRAILVRIGSNNQVKIRRS